MIKLVCQKCGKTFTENIYPENCICWQCKNNINKDDKSFYNDLEQQVKDLFGFN